MTDAELRDNSLKHLYYELWMLRETAGRLLHDNRIHRDLVIKNAMVESFCVHARAVAAFLYPEKFASRDGDITATDYVTDSPKWRATRGEQLPEVLLDLKERTGKEIAHLTSDRKEYDDPGKEWPTAQIVDTLLALLKVFVQHVPRERLALFVEGYITGLQSSMAQKQIWIYNVGTTGIITASGPFPSF